MLQDYQGADGRHPREPEGAAYQRYGCADRKRRGRESDNRLDLASMFRSDQVRNVDGRCDTLPNFLAWILVNIGKFQHQGQDVLPLLRNSESATGAGITTT
jgi:hypothetical protein